VDDDGPHSGSELDARPPDGVVLYEVGEDGMDDQIAMVRTRYDYKVYAIPGKQLLGEFDLPGTTLCDFGIVTRSEIPTEPGYSAIVERLAPLLR
jgi:hypothetical protein